MPDLPFTAHDIAYLNSPIRACVARVTLQPYYEPAPAHGRALAAGFPPLAACMRDACAVVASELPDYTHGLLVHAVQHWSDRPAAPPSLSTLQQYATRWARVKLIVMPPPMESDAPTGTCVLLTADNGSVPKWVWHHLAASLVHPAETVGPPPPL